MAELNRDVNKRDMMLFGEEYDKAKYLGGIRRFGGLNAFRLSALLDAGFIDADEAQNDSPTTEEFLAFMKEHHDFTAFGYAVCPERDDYRITIDGIESDVLFNTLDEVNDFFMLCRGADELTITPPYAWWD